MPWLYFAVSVWGALFTLNALFPARNRFFMVPSFFAAWLTLEMPAHHLFWQAAGTAGFVSLGALGDWPGWVGLGLSAVSWAGLLVHLLRGRRAAMQMQEAVGDLVALGDAPAVPWTKLFRPFSYKRKGVEVVRKVEFARAGGRTLNLDVVKPKGPGTGRPGLMQIHGGAWVMGHKKYQGNPLMGHMAANGWVCIDVDYRLSPFATWPDHLVDCKRAVAWYREHAEEYGADPDFLCVTGGSAGAHIGAMLALTPNRPDLQPGFESVDTRVVAAVPIYGIYDMTNRFGTWHAETVPWFFGPWIVKAGLQDEPEKFAAASPIDNLRPDAPPFLVIHGTRDTLAQHEDAVHFVDRLRDVSNQPVLFAELVGAHHAFDIFWSSRTRHVVMAVERFLTGVHTHHQEVSEADVAALSQSV